MIDSLVVSSVIDVALDRASSALLLSSLEGSVWKWSNQVSERRIVSFYVKLN